MDKAQLRLELIKLTYTHGRDVCEAVARAKALEAYLNDDSSVEASEPKNKGGATPNKGSGKKAANVNILD